MTYSVFGQRWAAGELLNTSVFQPFKPVNDLVIRAFRTKIIVFNDPVFTDLNMKIYSDDLGTPKELLHTSTNVRTKAQLHVDDNAVKETFFQFNDIVLKGGDTYHAVINGTGYSPTGTSYLAWMKSFPDPVNATGLTINQGELGVFPSFMALIADRV